MEHAHRTYVHADHIVTVPVQHVYVVEQAISQYETHELRRLAQERLAQFDVVIDCDDADPMWCAAVLYYYVGPLWACGL